MRPIRISWGWCFTSPVTTVMTPSSAPPRPRLTPASPRVAFMSRRPGGDPIRVSGPVVLRVLHEDPVAGEHTIGSHAAFDHDGEAFFEDASRLARVVDRDGGAQVGHGEVGLVRVVLEGTLVDGALDTEALAGQALLAMADLVGVA